MNNKFSHKQKRNISRISGLILINAMIFQEILADYNEKVFPLQKMLTKENLLSSFSSHWDFILNKINYFPIFNVAREILLNLTANQSVIKALKNLIKTAQRIVSMRAALRHDLMGRIYHRLLVEAKYLGTYYTSIPAATLLLKLALRSHAWTIDWHNIEKVKKLRIADLACGTGTLLMAAADSVTDNYISSSAEQGKEIKIPELHKILSEDVLHGYDVLPSAIHLTASTLALRTPHIAFKDMKLFCLRLGGKDQLLGSIEFLTTEQLILEQDLFRNSDKMKQITGKEEKDVHSIEMPKIDLCVMNPPFTRSVGGNLLFGSMPEDERKGMQNKLKKRVRENNISASIIVGLGSVFTATADRFIKPGGRIALVLPKALLSGPAWGKTRDLLCRNYQVEYIIVSHDPNRWNFSENTDLSEVLIIAVKNEKAIQKKVDSSLVTAINLWCNPKTSFESLSIAHTVTKNKIPDIEHGQGSLEIAIGKKKFGEAVTYPWSELKVRFNWMLPFSFAQSELTRVAAQLLEGKLWLPGYGKVANLPFCELDKFGYLGPDGRDIHDGFVKSHVSTAYPALWSHKSKNIYNIAQKPNCYLSPRSEPIKNRHLRKVEDLWPLAGKMLISERLRLNTHRLTCVLLNQPVLSNDWWSFPFKKEFNNLYNHKALVLWFNSTLCFLLLAVNRVETEGPWVSFKKPTLRKFPVLDLSSLSKTQIKNLNYLFDQVSKVKFQPFPEMYTDPVRAKIDKSLAKILHLPDFSILRKLLSQEPVICNRPLF